MSDNHTDQENQQGSMGQREAVITADLEPEGAGAGEISSGSKSSTGAEG